MLVALGQDVDNLSIGDNSIFKPFSGFHLGEFP